MKQKYIKSNIFLFLLFGISLVFIALLKSKIIKKTPVEIRNPIYDKLDTLNQQFDYNLYKANQEKDSVMFYDNSGDIKKASLHLVMLENYKQKLDSIAAKCKILLNKR